MTEKKTWVVTGASGFVGSRLACLLAEELLVSNNKSVSILCLVRHTSDTSQLANMCKQALLAGLIRVERLNLCDPNQLRSILPENVTHIYHCAAQGGDWGPKEHFVTSNVVATNTLIEVSQELKQLRRFLHVSTVDIYPHIPPNQCHEGVPPVKTSKYHYTQTKADSERAVSSSELPWTVIRPAVVYGPYSYTWGLQEAILLNQGKGVLIDHAKYRSGAVYIDDLVEAIILASRSTQSLRKYYNIANPNSSGTWRDFYDGIADGIKKPRVTFSIPLWLAGGATFFFGTVPSVIKN